MKHEIALTVNGTVRDAHVDSQDTLLDVLHDKLGMPDVRYGCGEGVCGTCTVLVDGSPISACLMLAVQADGHEITTAHGLCGAGESLHPLQQSFLRSGASQCGFCTPGMLLTAYDLVNRNGSPSRQEIRYALVGNLCRCTGYSTILDAVEEYAAEAAGGESKS